MDFSEAIKSGFHNYVNFSGRAARSEYWYWQLFFCLVGIASALIDLALFPQVAISPINTIVELALLLPTVAVSVRRLHDVDFTGWWLLLAFTGFGAFVLLGWFCLRGRRDRATDGGPNRFGADPLGGAASSSIGISPPAGA
jgi:uncharacterized membrane protein YhaH (DUF805 family)